MENSLLLKMGIFIIEKSEETTSNFLQNYVRIV